MQGQQKARAEIFQDLEDSHGTKLKCNTEGKNEKGAKGQNLTDI